MEKWDLIKRLYSILSIPWILGGDFNEITGDSEKLGGAVRRQKLMEDFIEVIDSCSLIDAGADNDIFIWYKKLRGQVIWERLDRFLLNIELANLCSNISVHYLDFLASDHRLTLLPRIGGSHLPDGA